MKTEDLVAAFLAKGGAITKVETGTRAIASDSTIYAAMREGTKAAADHVVEDQKAEKLWHDQFDAAAEARHNGHRVTGTEGNGVTISRNGRSTRY